MRVITTCRCQTKKKKGLGSGKKTHLSVFHPDGSKDVVRITNAIQRWNVALIYVNDIVQGKGEPRRPTKETFSEQTPTMYVHPALAQLKSTCRLDVVDGLRKSLGYRLVKKR